MADEKKFREIKYWEKTMELILKINTMKIN